MITRNYHKSFIFLTFRNLIGEFRKESLHFEVILEIARDVKFFTQIHSNIIFVRIKSGQQIKSTQSCNKYL